MTKKTNSRCRLFETITKQADDRGQARRVDASAMTVAGVVSSPLMPPVAEAEIGADDFLKRLADEKAARRSKLHAEYVALVRGLAGGMLSATDQQTLRETIGELGLDIDAVKVDVDAFQRAEKLESDSAGLAEAEQAAREASDAEREFEQQAIKQIAELQLRQQRATLARGEAAATAQRMKTAAARLANLRRERADIFGGPTLEQFNRSVHLLQCVFGQPANTPHDVRTFEQLMAEPTLFRPDVQIYVPGPGQSQAELDDLIGRAVAMQTAAAKKVFVASHYLARESDRPKIQIAGAVVFVDLPVDVTLRIDQVIWQRLPDQSAEEFSKLVADFTRKVKRAQKSHDDSARYGKNFEVQRGTFTTHRV